MNYDELSDFDINKAVAVALGHELCEVIIPNPARTHAAVMPTETLGQRNFDYCNSPADAWPIILENRITTLPDGNEWAATDNLSWQSGDNPLRCAMIVFLKLKEVTDEH